HNYLVNKSLLFKQQTLNKGKQSPGVYDISFPLKDLPAGVYILKIMYGDKVETRKVICTSK
ncbi:MAG: T9SS type A sorting domain-containing protein, partial [Bacteroidota bacterium]